MLPGYVPQLLVLVLELGNSASHSARVAYLAAATGLFQDSTQMPPEAYIAMQPYLIVLWRKVYFLLPKSHQIT
jgi:hypothetical protein